MPGVCREQPTSPGGREAVTPLACVPEFGKLSHLSGRSPERVIHYEAMRETGSDELMELVDTSATHIGHSVRFVYCTRPQHIQLPIRHAMREVRVLPIPGIVFACTVGPDASRCMRALACHEARAFCGHCRSARSRSRRQSPSCAAARRPG